jgi:hypothetical protein
MAGVGVGLVGISLFMFSEWLVNKYRQERATEQLLQRINRTDKVTRF